MLGVGKSWSCREVFGQRIQLAGLVTEGPQKKRSCIDLDQGIDREQRREKGKVEEKGYPQGQ